MRADVQTTHVYKVLSSMKNITLVRFSISKRLFEGSRGYDAMTEERYFGFFKKWVHKVTMRVSITWEADELTDVYALHNLLPPVLGFQLEKYANGKPAPRLTGRALAVEAVHA